MARFFVAALAVAALVAVASASQLRGASVCRGDWCVTGRVSDTSVLNLYIGVAQKNLDVLARVHSQVNDPDHALYGQFLTHEELTTLTSRPESTDAILTFLNAGGVKPSMIKVGSTGGFIEVDAPAGILNKLFNTEFFVFVSQDKFRIARALDAFIPESLAEHIDFVLNLDDFPLPGAMEPDFGGAKRHTDAANGDELVTPTSLASYYNINAKADDNTKSTMAVFECQNQYFTPSDLATFQNKYNIPKKPVANITGGNQGDMPGLEAQLDVQYIGATGLNVPLTFWYVSGGLFDPFPTIVAKWAGSVADDPVAPLVHSMSYGLGESNIASTPKATLDRINTEVQKMGTRGISVFIASGDSGVAGRNANSDPSACGFDPSWPTSVPYATSVGATQWTNGAQADGETTCSIANTPAALITSGGGFSTLFKRPSYQDALVTKWFTPSRVKTGQETYEKGYRGIPDVSALGHNYNIVSGGQFERVDGTSCSTPAFAGMIANINARLLKAGKSPVGWVTPLLFKLAAGAQSPFNDITTGNNKCTEGICCPQGYSAVAGWDPATGVGTPHYSKLSDAIMNSKGVPADHPARTIPEDELLF